MAGTLLFSNNASSALTGAITSSATALQVSAGTGVLFPNPGAGQYFVATIVDSATGLQKEIIWVTQNSSDTFTITRAQEGTVAQAWNAGDIVANLWTAGQASNMVQQSQLVQAVSTVYTGVDSGAVNSMVITTTQPLTSLAAGVEIDVIPLFTNTSTVLANVNQLGSKNVLRVDGTPLLPGDYNNSGMIKLIYNGTAFNMVSMTGQVQYKSTTRAVSTTTVALGLSDIGCQITLNNPTTTQNVTLPDHTSSSIKAGYTVTLTKTGSSLAIVSASAGASVINNGTATLAASVTMNPGEDATFTWNGTFWVASGTFMARYVVTTLGQSLSTNGYQRFAGGLILQWGTVTPGAISSGDYPVTFPIVFPNAWLNAQVTSYLYPTTLTNQIVWTTKNQATNGMTVTATGQFNTGPFNNMGFQWSVIGF